MNETALLDSLLMGFFYAIVGFGVIFSGAMLVRWIVEAIYKREVVDRACETANALVDEFERRGWYLDLPDPVLLADEK